MGESECREGCATCVWREPVRLQPQLRHETKIWSSRSPTRSAIAQTARRPSVDITDTTPAHTAAASRPDRHHTHGHQVAIVGWHLYKPYGRIAFARSTRPTAHRQASTLNSRTAGMLLRAAIEWCSVGMARKSCGRDKSNAEVCATRRHQRVKAVKRPARAHDLRRRSLHG